jgi:AraC-like DNA-binding protein
MAFLTNTRLQMAYTMINEVKDGIQVADLAYSVGFNDAKYFSKKFKEKYGISPNKMMTRQSVENV